MNKTGLFSTISLLTVSLLFTNPVFAHGGMGYDSERPHQKSMFRGKHHKGGPLGYVKHIMRSLELSDQQREDIEQVVEEARPGFTEIMEAMRSQRQEIHELVTADSTDMAAIEAAAEAQSQLMKQMIIEGAQTKTAIFQILTKDQRNQLRERMEKRRGL